MDPSDLDWDNVVDYRPQRSQVRARFYREVEYDEKRSLLEGVPRYNGVDKVEIINPETPNTVRRAKVTEDHKRKFKKQWQRYSQERDISDEGTPIEVMVWLGYERIAELKHVGINTVEKLAELPADFARRFGPGMVRAVSQAKHILEGPGGEVEALRKQVAELETEVTALKSKLMNPAPQRATG